MAGLSQTEARLEGLGLALEMTSLFLLVFLSGNIVTWLLTEVPVGGLVGFDPFLFSIGKFSSQSCICPRRRG